MRPSGGVAQNCLSALLVALVPGGKWQQRNVSRLLNGARQAALMRGANTAQASWNNLAALCHELLQKPYVLVRNSVDLFRAELAHLLSAEELSASAGSAGSTARATQARSWSG